MRIALLALMIAFQAHAGEPEPSGFKNKIGVGLDNWVRYERLLPGGFRIGTDWRYRIVVEGRKNIHADQQPEYWLLSAAHKASWDFVAWENRINWLGGDSFLTAARFRSRLVKDIGFSGRWVLSPFVEVVDYAFEGSAIDDEWTSNANAHHLEFDTQLGLNLEILF